MNKFSKIGERGLVVYDGNYHYVNEDDWRSKKALKEPAGPTDTLNSIQKLGGILANLADQNTVYVDLDKFPAPADEAVPAAAPQVNNWTSSKQSIVLREQNVLYQVVQEDWKKLDEGYEGDAAVVVNRGAIVGTIPKNNIPSGTYCVLVNLGAIKGS